MQQKFKIAFSEIMLKTHILEKLELTNKNAVKIEFIDDIICDLQSLVKQIDEYKKNPRKEKETVAASVKG